MFWNHIAAVYDCFEEIYNKKVYLNTGKTVIESIEKTDDVLECACGTGAISVWIAGVCRQLVATDLAENMLKRAAKKGRSFQNVRCQSSGTTPPLLNSSRISFVSPMVNSGARSMPIFSRRS